MMISCMNIISILKIVIKNIWHSFAIALLCQRCANLRACNLKIEVADRISKRFIRGKGLSVFFPRVVANNIFVYYCVLFCWYLFNLSCKLASPCKNSLRYLEMAETVVKFF